MTDDLFRLAVHRRRIDETRACIVKFFEKRIQVLNRRFVLGRNVELEPGAHTDDGKFFIRGKDNTFEDFLHSCKYNKLCESDHFTTTQNPPYNKILAGTPTDT